MCASFFDGVYLKKKAVSFGTLYCVCIEILKQWEKLTNNFDVLSAPLSTRLRYYLIIVFISTVSKIILFM